MKKTTPKLVLSLLLLAGTTTLFGQVNPKSNQQLTPSGHIRCYTDENEEALKHEHPNRLMTDEFEAWLAPMVKQIKEEKLKSRSANAAPTTIYKIPVVIHIIHNGDALGTGENISDAQALSQITVLNQDFRRMLGTPGHNTNPVGSDMEIEFVMAKRKPDGTATNGIDRVNRSVAQYANRTAIENMKKVTVWDASKYMNIWTVRIGGGSTNWNGTLGYAQFPSNSSLIGMDNPSPASTEHLTDGLLMRFDAFGSKALVPSANLMSRYDKGRTATHEVGHWAGLRHIWGDGDCTKDDFCNDTPNAGKANYGCPTGTDSCTDPGVDMIENYMDYTDDTCMNIFTQDQKARVQAVFLKAERRNSLLYSDALVPVGIALDAGVTIENDGINACDLGLNPIVRLKNYGTSAITSAIIKYSLDNTNVQTYNFTGNITTGGHVLINLPTLIFRNAQQNLYINLEQVNNSTDLFPDNDATGKQVFRPSPVSGNAVTFNLQLDAYGSETSWNLKDNTGTILYSGSNYSDSTVSTVLPALITQTWNLSPNTCYTFTINDSELDGLMGGGYYKALDQSGQTIFSGGGFKSVGTNNFIISALGTDDYDFKDLTLFPNPTKDILNISFENDYANSKYIIFNSLGQMVLKSDINSPNDLQVNTTNFSNGVYFIKIMKDGAYKTLQFIKN